MKKIYGLVILVILTLIIGLTVYSFTNRDKLNDNSNDNLEKRSEKDMDLKINIIVNGKSFTASLVDSETTKKFVTMLPLELNMSELNGNEKYYYLDDNLPTSSYSPKRIEVGDIMLFGNNCLVLFYKSFDTSYDYTRIGQIDDVSGFSEALGNGNVTVEITH